MVRFPNVQGANLEGRRYNLPHDFEGDYNLVLIAFEQWHQSIVDTWLPFTKALKAEFPQARAYELPTIRRMGWLNERMLDMGMRMGIPDRGIREATITLYLDVGEFCLTLALPTSRQVYAMLVRRDGEVLWQTTGEYRPELGAAVMQRLRQLQELV